jgi:hypothetical protein
VGELLLAAQGRLTGIKPVQAPRAAAADAIGASSSRRPSSSPALNTEAYREARRRNAARGAGDNVGTKGKISQSPNKSTVSWPAAENDQAMSDRPDLLGSSDAAGTAAVAPGDSAELLLEVMDARPPSCSGCARSRTGSMQTC